jgi:dihydropteroate synthase
LRIYKLANDINPTTYLEELNVDKSGVKILSQKMEQLCVKIEGLKCGAANILKQDALSVGADLAVPSGVIICEEPIVDAILIGTVRQLARLAQKEMAQPFGLKTVAKTLKTLLATPSFAPKIMGIINANDDSFFSGSRFQGSSAIEAIETMIEGGATIIDVGGVSSRPGSDVVSVDEELARVQPILDAIGEQKLYEKARFSMDTYQPAVAQYALEHGFSIINDITGLGDDKLAEVIAKYKAAVVIMHMQGDPKTMQANPTYESVITEVDDFFAGQIEKANRFGIEEVILDVGIGFGKTLEHNLSLLKHLSHYKHFGLELLVGASRKSMIDKIAPSSVENRLAGTLALHLKALDEGASILRVHDVAEHVQALAIYNALKEA